jgi:cytochrome o ubiquinol oxidase operon protein cyoD
MKISSSLTRDFAPYFIGYLLAIVLTGCAFSCVYFRLLPPGLTFTIVLGLALTQVIVHMLCFLHVSLQRSARANLQLLIFSAVIIMLMVGGTLVILFNERARMM